MKGPKHRSVILCLIFFTLIGLGHSLNFVCPRPKGQFADAESCHLFYQCENSISYRHFCPLGALYDGARHQCVNRHEKVLCGPQPSTEPPTTTIDPNAALPCDPVTCQLPYCFCSESGTEIPGNLARDQTPQMIMITFDGAVNLLNYGVYNTIFLENRTNPNGCPIRSTFFMTHEYTDYSQVQELYSQGHEMAVASVSRRQGLEDETVEAWVGEMVTMREILSTYASVHPNDVIGMRAPHVKPGRNAQFETLYDYGFIWDSSMVVPPKKIPVWPYTLDYKSPHECKAETCPTGSFPGIWEVPMNSHYQDDRYEGGYCPYLDQCGLLFFTENDVLQWLKKDFHRHYDNNRAPYMISVSINWFNTPAQHKGLLSFIDYTLSLPDVYYTTMTELVQWVNDPQPVKSLTNYAAFDCSQKILPDPPCAHPNTCPLVLDGGREGVPEGTGGTRYMVTCERCPLSFPWIFDAKGRGKGSSKDTYQKVQFSK